MPSLHNISNFSHKLINCNLLNVEGKELYMIRVKFGPQDSTFLIVLHEYQIGFLFCRWINMKYISHLFISFYFMCWQSAAIIRIQSKQSNMHILLIFYRIGNIERSFEQAKSFCQSLNLYGHNAYFILKYFCLYLRSMFSNRKLPSKSRHKKNAKMVGKKSDVMPFGSK